MTTVEADWAEFVANTGIDIEGEPATSNAKALYFAAFSRGWLAAIGHLQDRNDQIHDELRSLQAVLGRPQ